MTPAPGHPPLSDARAATGRTPNAPQSPFSRRAMTATHAASRQRPPRDKVLGAPKSPHRAAAATAAPGQPPPPRTSPRGRDEGEPSFPFRLAHRCLASPLAHWHEHQHQRHHARLGTNRNINPAAVEEAEWVETEQ